MAPKRRNTFSGGRRGRKKSKLNLMTIRQKQDLRQFGEFHPVENSDTVKSYTKVVDEPLEEKDVKTGDGSSSEESDAEVPAIKELMAEIGMKEEEPSSEEGSEEESADEDVESADEDAESADGDDEEVVSESQEESEGDGDSSVSANGDVEEEDNSSDLSSDELEDGSPKEKTIPANAEENIEAQMEDQDLTSESCEDDGNITDEEEFNLDSNKTSQDPFNKHFEPEVDMTDLFEDSRHKWNKQQITIPGLGKSLLMYKHASELPETPKTFDLIQQHVKKKLCDQVATTNAELGQVILKVKRKESLTSFQERLFSIINSYQDLLYPKQTHTNTEEIRLVYCIHALNHVLKSRARITAHNMKLKQSKDLSSDDIEYRDQGLTRPKVLIVLPYRDRALKVVNMFISLLTSSRKTNVSNRKRFEGEYSELEDSGLESKAYKSDDFKKMFEGNTDDNFRLGMTVAKESLHLYTPFYESDIILASPLGLRTIIGLEGDKERDFDFLSSIEVMIVDQADVYPMQNWDHFLHVCKHLHMQPRESHGVDFSRVRMWSINGWSKNFRQTLLFSSVLLPEMLTIFNKHCHNYAGKLLVQKTIAVGAIETCVSDVPQTFHQVICDSPDSICQRKEKMEYFKKKIIPYHTSAGMKQTLIFCNYFSFVQLRNFFRESEIDYLFMNEYDTEQKMRNARIHFRKRHPHFMLYTERLHFHYRFRLRGIHHILWFDLPQYPHFYSEMVNLIESSRQASTITTLFTKYEAQRLAEVVGSKQAALIVNSEKTVNMITVS